MTRLESLSADLFAKLQGASAKKQHSAALAACEFAIAHGQVEHHLVDKMLKKVRALGTFTLIEKAKLVLLTAQYDDKYLKLQEAAEKGKATKEEFRRFFSKARAVASLSFAGNEDAFYAATESIVEAAATTDDLEELFVLIDSAIK